MPMIFLLSQAFLIFFRMHRNACATPLETSVHHVVHDNKFEYDYDFILFQIMGNTTVTLRVHMFQGDKGNALLLISKK